MFATAHPSQTVYHGPVIYPNALEQRLARTVSDLDPLLLHLFMKTRRLARSANIGSPCGPPRTRARTGSTYKL